MFSKLFWPPTLSFPGKWSKELFPCQISLRQHFSREVQFKRVWSRQILHKFSLCAPNVRLSFSVKGTSFTSFSFPDLHERSDELYPCWNAVVQPAIFESLVGRCHQFRPLQLFPHFEQFTSAHFLGCHRGPQFFLCTFQTTRKWWQSFICLNSFKHFILCYGRLH